jgi:hypothetical protein
MGKRRDFIKKLKKFGFEPPEPGGRHFYMRYKTYTLTLPSNKEYSVPQVKMLLGKRGQSLNCELILLNVVNSSWLSRSLDFNDLAAWLTAE